MEHFKSLIYTLKKGYKRNIVDVGEENKIKDKLYKIIENCISKYENILNIKIKEDELYLIRLHFLASIERNNNINKCKKIYVITNLGEGSKKILYKTLNSKFLIDIKGIGLETDLVDIINEDLDTNIILTTNDLNNEYIDKTILKIKPILTSKDINRIEAEGIVKNNNKIFISDLMNIIKKHTLIKNESLLINDLKSNLKNIVVDVNRVHRFDKSIIKEENIIFDLKFENIEKAVLKSLEMLEGDYTSNKYTMDVIKILKETPNYLIRNNKVIIPHTKNKNSVYKTGISIITLSTPVIIPNTNEEIDTIVTFAINNEDNMLEIISNIIMKVFTFEFKEYLFNKNKKELINYLEREVM